VVAPVPVAVKLREYVPSETLVVVNGMFPVPPQVVGFTGVPTVKVGAVGAVNVFEVAVVPVQPLLVTEKLLYVPAFKPLNVKEFAVTIILCGLVVAPVPVAVKLNEYVPSGTLVVNGIFPVPPQVVGFTAVPAVRVGAVGSVNVFEVAVVPVQLFVVMEKLLYVPAFKPFRVKALLVTVIFCGLIVAPVPVAVKLNE
jgi:hypothetical protein